MRPDDRGFETERVSVVTFDSYGTLVDTASAATALEGVVDDPETTAREWRRSALVYSLAATPIEQYRTYFELHRSALADTLAAEGVDLTADRIAELTGVYHRLDPFEDVREGFERLAGAGYRPSIVSNGDPGMLVSLVETTGIEGTVDTVVSADEIRTLKPTAALYEHAAERLGVPIERIAHVTAHWMDVLGAIHAGMQGVWLAREGTSWASFDGAPHLTVGSIPDLCAVLDA
jgi:2-haloacid dehalogenase